VGSASEQSCISQPTNFTRRSNQLNRLGRADRSSECITALLNAGADPNVGDNIGYTPLHDVTFPNLSSKIQDMVTSLLADGANLEAQNNNGWTLIFTATDLRSEKAVTALIGCSADVNALDFNNIPPIGRAIFRGNDVNVQQLFQCGTMPSWISMNHDVQNILEEATLSSTVKVIDIISNSAIRPVKCNVTTLRYWFNTYRNRVYGTRCSPEELAAFSQLLNMKAILLEGARSLDSPIGVEDTLNEMEGGDDYDDDDDDEHKDIFEDAIEEISFLNEPVTLATCPL
jgi:hypothetical protein